MGYWQNTQVTLAGWTSTQVYAGLHRWSGEKRLPAYRACAESPWENWRLSLRRLYRQGWYML